MLSYTVHSVITNKVPDNCCKVTYTGNNDPIKRQNNILKQLEDKYEIIETDQLTPKDILELTHQKQYIKFLSSVWNSWIEQQHKTGFDPCYLNKNGGLVPFHFHRRKPFQTINYLCYWKQIGYYCNDIETPIFDITYELASRSAFNVIQAVNLIDEYELIYCLNTYPGHHSMTDGYGGYCYLNNVSIGVNYYLQQKNLKNIYENTENIRISILDLDYHHGDGTQEIFYQNPNIQTLSVHGTPHLEYPSFSGYKHEKGFKDSNFNYCGKPKCDINKYKSMVGNCIKEIIKFNPEIVFIAFGGDTYIHDPEISLLCGFNLELKDYYDLGKMLRQLRKPMIITQEGGYHMDDMGQIVDNFLSGITKRKI